MKTNMKRKLRSTITDQRAEFKHSHITKLKDYGTKINERINIVKSFENKINEFYNKNTGDKKEILVRVSTFVNELTKIYKNEVVPLLNVCQMRSVSPNPDHSRKVNSIMEHFDDASGDSANCVIEALSESCDVNIPDSLERRLNATGFGALELRELLASDKEIISRRLERNSELRKNFSGAKELVEYIDEEKNLLDQYEFRRSEILNFANFLEEISKPNGLSHGKKTLKFLYITERERLWADLMSNTKDIGSKLPELALSEAQEVSSPGKNLRRAAAGIGAGGLIGLAAGLTGHMDPFVSATTFATGTGTAIKLLVDSYTLNTSQFDTDSPLQKAEEASAVASKLARLDLTPSDSAELYDLATTLYAKAAIVGDNASTDREVYLRQAGDVINRAIELDDKNSKFYELKGDIRQQLNDLNEALVAYESAIDLEGETKLSFREKFYDSWHNNIRDTKDDPPRVAKHLSGKKAAVLWKQGKLEEAKEVLKDTFKWKDEKLEDVLALRNKGDRLFNDGKFTKALKIYEKAVKIEPDPILHERLAHTKYKLCDFKGAIDELKAAVSIYPDYITEDKPVFGDSDLTKALIEKDSKFVLNWANSKTRELYSLLLSRAKARLGEDKAKAFGNRFEKFVLQKSKEYNIDENKVDLEGYVNNLTEDEFPDAENFIGSISNELSSFVKNLYANNRRLTDSIVEVTYGKAHKWYRQLNDSEELWAAFIPAAVIAPLTIATPFVALSGKPDVLLGITIPNILGWYTSAYLTNRAIDLGAKYELEQEKEAISELLGYCATIVDGHITPREKESESADEFECPLCGATVVDADVKCPECGAEFEEADVPEEEENPTPSPAPIPSVAAATSVDESESASIVIKKVARRPESVPSLPSSEDLEKSTETIDPGKLSADLEQPAQPEVKQKTTESQIRERYERRVGNWKSEGFKDDTINSLESLVTTGSLKDIKHEFEVTRRKIYRAKDIEVELLSYNKILSPQTVEALEQDLKSLKLKQVESYITQLEGWKASGTLAPEYVAEPAQPQSITDLEKLKGDRDVYELWLLTHQDQITESHKERLRKLDEQILNATPTGVADYQYIDALYVQSKELFANGKLKDALSTLDGVLVRSPDRADAWTTKGSVLEKLGRNKEAIIAYNQAVQLAPGNHEYVQAREAVREKIRAQQVEKELSESVTATPPKPESEKLTDETVDERLDRIIGELSEDSSDPVTAAPQVSVPGAKKRVPKKCLRVDIPQTVEGHAKKVGDEIYAKAAIMSSDTWYKINSQGKIVNEIGELVEAGRSVGISQGSRDSLKTFYEQACSSVAKELSDLVWAPVPEESSSVKELASELEVPEPLSISHLQETPKDTTHNQLPENVELTAPYALPDNAELAKPEITRDGRAALDEYTSGSDQLVAKLAARQLLYDFNCGRWGELYLNDLKVECGKLEGNLNTALAESKAQELAKKWGQDFIKSEKLNGTYANICVSLFVEYGITAVKSLSDIRNIKSLQANRYLSADRIQEILHNPPIQVIDLEQEVLRK